VRLVQPAAAQRYPASLPLADALRTDFNPQPQTSQYCDQGTLRDVVKGGAFRAPPVDGRAAMDLAPVLEILLDVAYAMQYLHSLQLVHGDIKVRAARPPLPDRPTCVFRHATTTFATARG
jgi:serine/threonine protein kinase